MRRAVILAAVPLAAAALVATTGGGAEAATVHPSAKVTVIDQPGAKATVVNRDGRAHTVKVSVRCTSGPWRGWAATGTVHVAAHRQETTTILTCSNVVTRARITA